LCLRFSFYLFFSYSQLSVDEVRERQQRLSKMRSLLFQHEAKAKRVAKIKSKTFRRLDKSKKMRDFMETDEEAVKEAGLKQEQKRAEVCPFSFPVVILHNIVFLHKIMVPKKIYGAESCQIQLLLLCRSWSGYCRTTHCSSTAYHMVQPVVVPVCL
jgi:hypothetical protein